MAKLTVGYAADGTAKDYTTLAAAYAAAAACDELEIWYRDQNMNPVWHETLNGGTTYSTKAVSITGALSGRKVSFVNSGWFFYLYGDLSGNASRVTVKNCSFTDLGYLGYGVCYNPTSGGAGITVENCVFIGQDIANYMVGANAGDCILRNCLFIACNYGTYWAGTAGSCVGNTFIRCTNGITFLNNTGSVVKNNLVLNCATSFANNVGWSGTTASHNVGDSSASPPPGTSTQIISRATAKLVCDSVGGFDVDARLMPDSPLIGAGAAHTDMSATDIDGKTRGTPPAIGCSEGVGAYTDPGEATVLADHTYLFAGATKTGTLPAAATAAELAAAVWDAATVDHDTADTFGKLTADTKASVDNLAIAGTAVLYAPTSATRDTGSDQGGTYTNLSARDDSNMVTGETTAAPGLEVTVIRSTSEADEIPSIVNVYGYYKGVQEHHVEVRAWNYLTSAWDAIGLMINRAAAFEYSFPLNSAHHSAAGEMKLSFLHDAVTLNATHRLYLDWISWQKVATNSTLGSDIAAIRSKTDNLPEFPANEETVAALDIPTVEEIAAEVGATKLAEIHQLLELDAANPVTFTPTSIKTGSIEIALTGDGTATTTATRTT